MVYVTVVMPIGEAHVELAQRALASVRAQFEPCNVLYEIDTEHVGPGALRNRLLAQVDTPFVIFLDADDWLDPSFVKETLREWRRSHKYVYTDWILAGINEPKPAPTKAWCGGTWHTITALIPTAWAKEVGGFDETLPAMEDTDFYMKLVTSRHCGIRLPMALFTYSNDGLRSDELRSDETVYNSVKTLIQRRYTGMLGCCGDEVDYPPIGARMDNDVQAQALWQGKHTEASLWNEGRIYPRMAYPATTWVDKRDVASQPDKWRLVELPVDEAQPMNALDGLELAMNLAQGNAAPAPAEYVPPKATPVVGKPDVAKIRQMGAKRKK